MSSRSHRDSRDRRSPSHRERERSHSSRYDRDRGDRGSRSSRYESSSSRRQRSRSRDSDRRYRRDDRDTKRRRESPVATEPRKKRKSSLWDDTPAELSGLTQQEVCARLAQSATIPGTLPVATAVHTGFSPVHTGSNNTPFTQAKRLYVGNVPQSATEEDLKHFFRHQFIHAGFCSNDMEVVQSVQIKYDRNFAFIELDNSDLATKGLGFDGVSFQDHTLKVRRPRDYVGPDNSPLPGFIPGIISTNVPDTPNKVFVGGLPSALTEDQVKELVGHFGELKAFHLVKDNNNNVSKGFAFFEYLDASKTDMACRALNGKEVAGKNLLVQRAHLGSRNLNMLNQVTFDMGNSESVLGCLLNLSVPVKTTLTTNELDSTPEASSVLVLMNMISLEDLLEKEKRDELEAEIKAELSQFGTIKAIIIPHAATEEELDRVKGIGKVLVKFETSEQAEAAQKGVSLRKYNYRCVFTTYLDDQLFDEGFYDGPEDAGTEQALDKLQKHFQNAAQQEDQFSSHPNSYHSVPPPRM